jgi:hypothetical protein
LVEIPYWWDCKVGSLAATISEARPDLALKVDGHLPISKILPERAAKKRMLQQCLQFVISVSYLYKIACSAKRLD